MVMQDEMQRLGPSVDAMSKDGVMEAVLGQVCTTHNHRRLPCAMRWHARMCCVLLSFSQLLAVKSEVRGSAQCYMQ